MISTLKLHWILFRLVGMMSITGLGMFFLGFIHISPQWSFPILLLVSFCFPLPRISTLSPKHYSLLYVCGMLLMGTLFLSYFSLKQEDSVLGMKVYGASYEDSLWHIAIMQNLLKGIPPENPAFAQTPLRGYHYLNDLFWSGVHSVSGIPLTTVYLHLAPVFLAFLFCLSVFLLFHVFIASGSMAALGYAAVLISSNVTYVISYYFPHAGYRTDMLWMDIPLTYAMNQQLLLALTIVNVLLFLISTRQLSLFTMLLAGSLVGIKIYGFMIISVVLVLWLTLERFMFHRKWREFWLPGCILLLLVLPQLWIQRTAFGFPFFFQPGWFIKTAFEAGDRLHYPTWELQRLIFARDNNLVRLIWHWMYGLGVFLGGNFGLTLAGGILPWLYMVRRKKPEGMLPSLFLITSAIGIGFPLLWLQKGVVWNTIQFAYFAVIPLTFLTFASIDRSLKPLWLSAGVGGLIVVSGLPTTYAMLHQQTNPTAYTSFTGSRWQSIQALTASPPYTLLPSSTEESQSFLIPALTGRSWYIGSTNILSILGIDASVRLTRLEAIQHHERTCQSQERLISWSGNEIILKECHLPTWIAQPENKENKDVNE